MSSNYMTLDESRNDSVVDREPDEVECKRCRGLGEDRDGADCVPCDGLGSILR